LKTIKGSSAFLDLQNFEMDSAGDMQPTTRGIPISSANKLIRLIASAQRIGIIKPEAKE
jgi:hypothetical protein